MRKTSLLATVRRKLHPDSASIRNGVVTVRDEFFYRHGRTAADLVADVLRAFPNATILDSGEIWKPFNGGASTANSSHWFVKFTVDATDRNELRSS
jgi:hypothetical protein